MSACPPPKGRALARHQPSRSTVPSQPVAGAACVPMDALTTPQLRSKYMAFRRELACTEFELVRVCHILGVVLPSYLITLRSPYLFVRPWKHRAGYGLGGADGGH